MKRKYNYFLLEILLTTNYWRNISFSNRSEFIEKFPTSCLNVHTWTYIYFWEKSFVIVHRQSRRSKDPGVGIIHRVNDRQGDRTIPGIGVAHGGYIGLYRRSRFINVWRIDRFWNRRRRGNRGSKSAGTLRSAHKYANTIQEDNEALKVVQQRSSCCVPANLIAVVHMTARLSRLSLAFWTNFQIVESFVKFRLLRKTTQGCCRWKINELAIFN